MKYKNMKWDLSQNECGTELYSVRWQKAEIFFLIACLSPPRK